LFFVLKEGGNVGKETTQIPPEVVERARAEGYID